MSERPDDGEPMRIRIWYIFENVLGTPVIFNMGVYHAWPDGATNVIYKTFASQEAFERGLEHQIRSAVDITLMGAAR